MIRRTTADDWVRVRELRLEMIRDTPMAFGESLETAFAHSEAQWRIRGDRGAGPRQTSLVAIDSATDRWVGTMGGFLESGRPLLVGVYVSPAFRGRSHGVAAALLEGIERWARSEGDTLALHVHQRNPRARTFYERHGFLATGVTVPYVLDPTNLEIEMVKQL